LIFGEYDAVQVDAMTTVAEAEALADWIALHNRNLETIYITHAHFDHFYGLSVSARPFPTRSGDRNAQGGGGHTDVFVSPSAAVSPPNVPWASAHEVGWT
jgi:glyoxylase-like metal-dependent hydrolase (beta-lactamase superfamily II)